MAGGERLMPRLGQGRRHPRARTPSATSAAEGTSVGAGGSTARADRGQSEDARLVRAPKAPTARATKVARNTWPTTASSAETARPPDPAAVRSP